MSSPLTINLSDRATHWVEWYALATGRSQAQVVAETVEQTLSPMATDSDSGLANWSDEEILAAAASTMPPPIETLFEQLRAKRDEDSLTAEEQQQLLAIGKISQVEQLRKARAMAEALRRGLTVDLP